MKGFLSNPIYINQLDKKQIELLNDYYTIIRGGIAKRIRSIIEKNVDKNLSEKDIYGDVENELYTVLIDFAHDLNKDKKNIESDIIKCINGAKPFDLFSKYKEFYIDELQKN
jgi:hypothetical protein